MIVHTMHTARRGIFVALTLLSMTNTLPLATLSAAEPGTTVRLARQWQRLANAGDRLVSRELFWFTDTALAAKSHQSEIEQPTSEPKRYRTATRQVQRTGTSAGTATFVESKHSFHGDI